MKGWTLWIFSFLMVVVTVGVAQCQETKAKTMVAVAAVVEQVRGGTVNWTKGYLEVSGEAAYPRGKPKAQARLMARRGAIMDAQRNLLEMIAGVRISAEAVMQDLEVISDVVRTRVEGTIKGAQIVREQDKGDSFQVTLRLPLSGDLADLVHTLQTEPEKIDQRLSKEDLVRLSPPQLTPIPSPTPTPPSAEPVPSPSLPSPKTPAPLPQVRTGPYTGLLIDCRGLKVKPSMSPKIRRPDGTEVWGTVNVSREYVIEHGIVGYLRNPKDLTHPDVIARIGQRPLVVRAIGVAGKFRTDPVLSEEDVQQVLEENEKYHFLDQMRVIFLIDQP